jgi:ferric-dicitrate binding protein FerR (iron transport regulator)
MRRYKKYSVEELAADQDFIRWVLDPQINDHDFWSAWLLTNPDQEEKVEAAVHLVKEMKTIFQVPVSAEQQELEKLKLLNRLHSKLSFKEGHYTRIAASIIFFVALIAGLYFLLVEEPVNQITVKTEFGETKTITLPDKSIISLNANSSLTYASDFYENRRVQLKGEAYFDIASLIENGRKKPFRVLTASGMKVEVLGTSFNINDRKTLPQVVLDHGRVLLSAVNNKIQPVTLRAGELSELDKEEQNFVVKQVDPSIFTSWKDGILFFKEESLDGIALLLQQNYNLDLIFESPGLETRKFTGSTPSSDLKVLFSALEIAFQLEINQEGNRIYIKENESIVK